MHEKIFQFQFNRSNMAPVIKSMRWLVFVEIDIFPGNLADEYAGNMHTFYLKKKKSKVAINI